MTFTSDISSAKPYRRLIYRSQCAIEMTPLILATIVEQSIQNNLRDKITGMLLYADDQFVQFLEGPPLAIGNCMARIKADPRHSDVEMLQDERSTERIAEKWSMKLLHEYPAGSAEIGAYNLAEYMEEAA